MIGLAVYAGARIPHGVGTPEFIGTAQGNNGTTVSLPAHAAGDLIIALGKGTGGGTPAASSGWTTPANGTWSFPEGVLGFRLQYIVDADNTITSATANSPGGTGFLIYRNATFGAVTPLSSAGGSSSLAAPSLSSSGGSGSTMVYIFHESLGNDFTSISGPVVERYVQLSGMGGGFARMLDSGVLVPVSPASTATVSLPSFIGSVVFELLPA